MKKGEKYKGYDGFHSFDGFDDLMKYLNECIDKVDTENVIKVLEVGASAYVGDLMKLPKPISKIKKAGYTHMINTFTYRKNKGQIEAGWGKYYGRMVEDGTVKMRSQKHMTPTFDQNKDKYYNLMTQAIGF